MTQSTDRRFPAVSDAKARALRIERDRYVAFAFCGADILLELDRSFKITFATGAVGSFMGAKADDMVGRPVFDFCAESSRAEFATHLKAAKPTVRIRMNGISFAHRGNSRQPQPTFSLRGYLLPEFNDRFYLTFRREGEERTVDKVQFPAAQRDTDTPQAATRAAAPAMAAASALPPPAPGMVDTNTLARMSGELLLDPAGAPTDNRLTLLEMQNLGHLRAALGQEAFDTMLQTLDEAVRDHSLDGQSAARMGDDRYGLVHNKSVNLDALKGHLAEITKKADPEGKGVAVKAASVGGEDLAGEMLNAADAAKALVYTIKSFDRASGTDLTVDAINKNLAGLMEKTTQRITDTRRIVNAGHFSMAFQPIVDLKARKLHHFESLIRIKSQNVKGSPFEFINFAESVDIVHEIDLAVAARVIAWVKEKAAQGERHAVAVNLSGRSLSSPAFVTRLQELLDANQDVQDLVLFELTESANIPDLESVNSVIQTFRARGCHFCLDDFGAGEAAFHYLRAIEVDMIKIDGSYVRDAVNRHKNKHIIKAIASLSTDLGVETIAEMVEDEDTVTLLRECGVQFGQGYLFGRPSENISDFKSLTMTSSVKRVAKSYIDLLR